MPETVMTHIAEVTRPSLEESVNKAMDLIIDMLEDGKVINRIIQCSQKYYDSSAKMPDTIYFICDMKDEDIHDLPVPIKYWCANCDQGFWSVEPTYLCDNCSMSG